ncbi:MAG: YitT family protein [Acutalibacteraceae bacterium]
MKNNSNLTKQSRAKTFLSIVRDALLMLAGSLLFAVAVDMFMAPNDVVAGGLTGISTMLNHLYGLPIGITTLIINIPLFIWGAIENGRKYLIKTIIGTVMSSLMVDFLADYIPTYTGERTLAALFGGLIMGLGLGLIIYGGGSTGGTDIISKNLRNHFPFLSIGTIIIIAGLFVIVATMIIYGSIESGLYSVIVIFISSKVIDTTIYGLSHDNGEVMFIMSSQYDDISKAIMNEVHRGVTLLDAQGGYTGKESKTIMCAVRPSQVYKVKSIASSIDKSAFIIVTKAEIIDGAGFPAMK